MENILIPSLAAITVVVVFLVIFAKMFADEKSQRTKTMLGKIVAGNQTSGELQEEEYQLLKQTSASSLLDIPLIRYHYDLIHKAAIWDKRGVFFAGTFVLFLVMQLLFSRFGFLGFLIATGIAYFAAWKYLTGKIHKHMRKFIDLFPEAIDMITRSVRSGYPINTAMRMISDNMESPVKEEFKKVIDEISYGRTLPEALKRMAKRVPEPDVNFFVVVMSVQQETGGSLAEVLTNLSNIIRKRKQLRAKIHALTSEGRMTSYILAAIPIIEFSALYFMTPTYLAPLFTTTLGNVLLAVAGLLIIASQVVVRAMMNVAI